MVLAGSVLHFAVLVRILAWCVERWCVWCVFGFSCVGFGSPSVGSGSGPGVLSFSIRFRRLPVRYRANVDLTQRSLREDVEASDVGEPPKRPEEEVSQSARPLSGTTL